MRPLTIREREALDRVSARWRRDSRETIGNAMLVGAIVLVFAIAASVLIWGGK